LLNLFLKPIGKRLTLPGLSGVLDNDNGLKGNIDFATPVGGETSSLEKQKDKRRGEHQKYQCPYEPLFYGLIDF